TGATVLAGTGFCFCEGGGGGYNRYIDDAVVYPPKPRGARVRPMISSNADGFHSGFYPVGVRHGPTLIGCYFEGTDDDGIAIHGVYVMLQHVQGTQIVILSNDGSFVRPGDTLKFYNSKGGFVGQNRVVSIAVANGYKPQRYSDNPHFQHASQFFSVKLNHAVLGAAFGDYIDDTDCNGSGFAIRDCTVRNNRARGMLIKADDGVIEDNTVDGSSMEGIVISPELNWNEAGCSSNLLIEGNTIRHVGDANAGPAYMAGAMSIVAYPHHNFLPRDFGHNNIAILQNRFIDNNGLNLLLVDARNVLMADNTFIDPMRNNHGGNIYGASSLIWMQECRNVFLAGNRVVVPGPAVKTLVGIGPDDSAVKGIGNGVKIKPSEKQPPYAGK
ncbi:MAG: right-handed parallel beta-helix repeat-containing protein, partial [Phycisphaerae bacterium]